MAKQQDSGPPDEAELDEQLEIVSGRRAPYTQVGDWVLLSGVSPKAMALYWMLAMHVNNARAGLGNTEVWPSLKTLAGWMKLGKPESVAPYIAELVKIGAIEKQSRRTASGMKTRNRYTVHQSPPEGYQGLVSVTQYYAALRMGRAGKAAGQSVPRSRGVRESAAGPADTESGITAGGDVPRSSGVREDAEDTRNGITAGQSVPRPSGVPYPAPEGVVPRSSGVELEEVELEENPSPPTPRSAEPAPSAGPATASQEGEGDTTSDGRSTALDAIVAEVLGHQPGWRQGKVRGALERAVADGRPHKLAATAMVALARGDFGTTHSPARLIEDGPWWSTAAPRAARAESEGARCDAHPWELLRSCRLCAGERIADGGERAARPAHAGPKVPPRRCAHGKVAVNCVKCRAEALAATDESAARPPLRVVS